MEGVIARVECHGRALRHGRRGPGSVPQFDLAALQSENGERAIRRGVTAIASTHSLGVADTSLDWIRWTA